ncbi:NAD(P)H-dependent oxidoreductase [Rhodohalobacter halophilus]|uniref:NAD(P)H-dependent oxidoreductase n=1 Tax=Rhodohalobacter halophilus TaxID=1812810 RepID=UPI00083F8921|nr:NAD(P)H-dependent oxidoreductase [Rhodohalobacter halophilus]
MNLIDALNWRYATKRMNGQQVPEEKIEKILDSIRLSASSMGLQPYTIFTVTNEELKKKLQPAAYNQPQIVEGSHLIVFAAWDDISEQQIDEYMQNIADVRGVTLDSLTDFRNSLINTVQSRTPEERYEWAARQVYIALGTALTAAAVEQVDATPMEGFIPEKVDEILNLREKGLRSVAMMALGYRDEENDFLAGAKKVRREKEKLILHLN